MVLQQLSTNTFTVARWVVSADVTQGTHTTIQGAINSASSGDSIYIRDGTYTENLTLKAGVDLNALIADAYEPNVIINGKCTFTGTGTVSISSIELQTNSDFLLAVTGSSASIVNLLNCNVNCLNNTGISFTSSNATAAINLDSCTGNIGTTGITLFTSTSAGNLNILFTEITNIGASTTASTVSTGFVTIINSYILFPLSTSSIGFIVSYNSTIDTHSTNTIAITTTGTGTSSLINVYMASGSASTVSVGAGTTVNTSNIIADSTNTNAITGAGSLLYTSVGLPNTSQAINVATKVPRVFLTGPISFDGGTNTLSVYTQGTFTPTIAGASTVGTATYSTQTGRYTRIGNRVFIFISLAYTAATGTGQIRVAGLPFTVNANDNSAFAFTQISTLAVGAALIPFMSATPSGTFASLATYNDATAAFAAVAMVAAATFIFSGSYEV